MKHLRIRHHQTGVDPLQSERLLKALKIILENQETCHASSTLRPSVNQSSTARGHHRESTALSQALHSAPRGDLLPEHDYLDDGLSGARLDRPALDRCRDAARRGEFDAVVVLSPDRLARNDAHQWLLVEEFEKLNTQWIFLQNPFGDPPQGKLLPKCKG